MFHELTLLLLLFDKEWIQVDGVGAFSPKILNPFALWLKIWFTGL
jgi:hypothetical protein